MNIILAITGAGLLFLGGLLGMAFMGKSTWPLMESQSVLIDDILKSFEKTVDNNGDLIKRIEKLEEEKFNLIKGGYLK